jgi:hypothetical protein
LREFIDKKLKNDLRLQNPTIESDVGTIYIPKPPQLEEEHRFKLDITLRELIQQGLMPSDKAAEY